MWCQGCFDLILLLGSGLAGILCCVVKSFDLRLSLGPGVYGSILGLLAMCQIERSDTTRYRTLLPTIWCCSFSTLHFLVIRFLIWCHVLLPYTFFGPGVYRRILKFSLSVRSKDLTPQCIEGSDTTMHRRI